MASFGAFSIPSAPAPAAAPPGGQSFGSFNIPAPNAGTMQHYQEVHDSAAQAQIGKANADYANSFKGLATSVAENNPITKFGEGLISPIIERGNAVVQSVQQHSLIPLEESFGSEYQPSKVSTDTKGNRTFIPAPMLDSLAQGFAGGEGAADTLAAEAAEKPTVEAPAPVAPEPKPATPPTKTLQQTHADYARSQGYEPYTPDHELPTIQTGKPAESALPTIKTEAPATRGVKGDLTFHPTPETQTPSTFGRFTLPETTKTAPDSVKTTPSTTAAPESRVVPLRESFKPTSEGSVKPLTPIGTGESAPSRLAANVETNAVEKKLTDTLGQLPEYNKVNMGEQARFASDLIKNEPDKAMNIAMGKEPPPAHILPEAVYTAMESKAVSEGDVDTLRRLATESNMSTQATAMGQRIRALGERDQSSPVKIIREISDRRQARATPKIREATKAEIKTELGKGTAAKKETWDTFVKSISCGY